MPESDVRIRGDRKGNSATLVLTGTFDLGHATTVAREMQSAEALLSGCSSVDVDLAQLDRIDGTGAALLARLLNRAESEGCRPVIVEGTNVDAARLISLYRARRLDRIPSRTTKSGTLALVGALVGQLPAKAKESLGFIGHLASAVKKATVTPSSVDWRSLPRLIQSIGADALPVTSAANLLVGVIIGFIGVSQLGRFGAIAFVPELVVVAHFRELGPLVTAIVVAGRSGAGLASEIATMKVSEEVDALRSMGFDPLPWLVVSRCLALAITVPLLTWVGDFLALVGGLLATIVLTDMTPRAYLTGTIAAVTPSHLFTGLAKSPFLALAVGLIACGEGLLTRGGAAAVGTRTTTAVVLAIFSVIVISSLFTFFYSLLEI